MADIKLTLVVACALVDADKRVLLAQRPMDADAAPPAGMPAGPQAPVAAPAPAPEDPVG